MTLSHCRSLDDGKTWSSLIPIVPAPQSHDGYQLLLGERIYVFFGWNKGSQPPVGDRLARTDMQLDEGFWMKWSDDYGATFSEEKKLRTRKPLIMSKCHLEMVIANVSYIESVSYTHLTLPTKA